MGDTFGCCCTDDPQEGIINMDKKQKQKELNSTEYSYIGITDTSKLLGESEEILSTNTNSTINDNENENSISETDNGTKQQTTEKAITNENEYESNTDSENKENETTTNINEEHSDTDNVINITEYGTNANEQKQNIIIKHSIIENDTKENDISENILHKDQYINTNNENIITETQNDNPNEIIEDNNDGNDNSDEDFDEDLAKLDSIQNYENEKKENNIAENITDTYNETKENDSTDNIITETQNEQPQKPEIETENTYDSDDMDNELAKLDNIKNYKIEKDNISGDDMGSDNSMIEIPENENINDNIIAINIRQEEKSIDNTLNDASMSRLLLQKYKSQNEMLDDERIETLLQMKLSDDVFKVLGDQTLYKIPNKKQGRFHLERDLRKIKLALREFKVSEPRKYAKIAILKHIDLLTAVYIKYCKIGGDRHWLTYDGWTSLLRDSNIIKMGDYNDEYFNIFTVTYDFHNKSTKHKKNKSKDRHSTQLSGLYGGESFHDKNPWTGIWCMVSDRQRINRIEKKKREAEERDRILKKKKNNKSNKKFNKKINKKISILAKSEQHFDKYKLRKIGDLRIIGCMNNMEYADIAGMTNKSNYKRAKLEIRFKKRRIKVHNQKRIWNCQLIPPKTIMDNIIMKIKWNEINQNSSKSKDGTFKLYKYDELKDDDNDLPVAQYVGLARYEFFDAILQLSMLLDESKKSSENNAFVGGLLGDDNDVKDMDLYETFDELCIDYLDEYIYKNIIELEKYMKGKDIVENVRMQLKGCNTILIKLFKKYASLDNDTITTKHEQHLDCDEWCAMAVELCKAAKSFDSKLWKLGGKPSMNEIIQCFVLCKNEDLIMDEEIDFIEFQRCLVWFTSTVYKYYPNARYKIMDFENKLELVCKWCEKLEAQKIGISSKSYHRSDTLKQIKRKKSMHQNAQSNQSSTYTPRQEFNTPTFSADWNTISNSF